MGFQYNPKELNFVAQPGTVTPSGTVVSSTHSLPYSGSPSQVQCPGGSFVWVRGSTQWSDARPQACEGAGCISNLQCYLQEFLANILIL